MKTTHKAIAVVIRDCNRADAIDSLHGQIGQDFILTEDLVRDLAKLFREDNPGFNATEFEAICFGRLKVD